MPHAYSDPLHSTYSTITITKKRDPAKTGSLPLSRSIIKPTLQIHELIVFFHERQ